MTKPPLNILMVEDNLADQRLLRENLVAADSAQFAITAVEELSQALTHLKRGGFDAILLDLSLPDSQGLATIEKALAAAPRTPIILLTGLVDEELAMEAVRRGAQDYLIKGRVDGESLMRSIRYAIGRQQIQDELQKARDELEVRVQQRTADLRSAVDALQDEVVARVSAENDLRKANRALRMIFECDQALVHAADERDLLQAICRNIIEIGGYRAAWVGMAGGEPAKEIVPLAYAGVMDDDAISKIGVTWADAPGGRCPTGAAIRTGKVAIGRNFLTDPDLSPWRRLAQDRGFASAAALPLSAEGKTFGVLTMYAAEPDAFDESEIALLTELAGDMSFGIATIRARRDRIRLESEVLRATEAERNRVGHDLHDSLGQNLTGIAFLCSVLRKRVADESPKAAEAAGEVERLVNESVDMTRALARGLSPVGITTDSLATGLFDLAGNAAEMFHVHCDVLCEKPVHIADAVAATHLYRIAQEAVSNAVKHGRCRQILIRLGETDEAIVLSVADDGIGISTSGAGNDGQPKGMGLRIMNYRANMIGAALSIVDDPEGGTLVTCRLTKT